MAKKTFTFVIMDAPYESARTVTALRLIDAAARRGHTVNVFAYEGAVHLPFAKQEPHANPVHGHDVEEEDHPLPKDWVGSILAAAKQSGGTINWINCGLCVDERGVGEWIESDAITRGGPRHLGEWVSQSDNTLVIGTR